MGGWGRRGTRMGVPVLCMSYLLNQKFSGRASPKKTISGFTRPPHAGHLGISFAATNSFILSFGNCHQLVPKRKTKQPPDSKKRRHKNV